ncbi:hypothetical protein [Spirosoma areae]
MALLRSYTSLRVVAFVLLTALLIWVEVVITHTSAFSRQPVGLSLAVLFDLVFVPTALFYWLVARPLRLAISRLGLVALLMVRVALLISPQGSFLPNQLWPLLLLFAEGTMLIIAGVRIRTLIRTYQRLRQRTDAETALHESLATVFGERMAGAVLGEILTLYYALLGWWLSSDVPAGAKTVTIHRQSGQTALLVGLLLVGAIEGVAVHLLLSRWSPTAAFWVTILSGYGLLFFVADAIATVKRPSYLTDNQVRIRLGIRWRAIIPRSAIAQVSLLHEKPVKQPDLLNGAFLTTPNVLLTFSKPVSFLGPYGLKKGVSRFAFFVDDRSAFVNQLTRRESNGIW